MITQPPAGRPPVQWPQPGPPTERMRTEAERVIEASGDGRAIRFLGQLRRDPRHWAETLIRLASESVVLKVALGVFLGVLAAEAVKGILKGDLLESLGQTVDGAIDEGGGMEALMAAATWSAAIGSAAPDSSASLVPAADAWSAQEPADPAVEGSEEADDDPGGDLDLDLDFDAPL